MAGPPHPAKLKQITNLWARGRRLHYENAERLVARALRLRLPSKIPGTADLVYRTVQLLFGLGFLEERSYLSEAEYDPFTDALFHQVAGPESTRIHGLLTTYAGALPDPQRLPSVIARDLAAALVGKRDMEKLAPHLIKTPGAMQRTTQLYCATAFGDQAMVRRLQ